jgi:hypothetical protein
VNGAMAGRATRRATRGWPAPLVGAFVAFTGCRAVLGLGDDYSSGAFDASDAPATSEASSDVGVDAASDVLPITPACAAYAAAYCSYISQCLPGILRREYDTLGSCRSVEGAQCTLDANAVPSVLTASWFDACSASLTMSASACSSGPVPMNVPSPNDPCAVVGPIPGGQPCGLDDQCQSSICARSPGAMCGNCLPGVGLGQPCSALTAVCTRGLVCGSRSTCVTLVGANAHCDLGITSACVTGTDCIVGDAGATSGTCLTAGSNGDPCDPNGVGAPKCNVPWGFYCDATLHCAPITYVPSGGSCGALGTSCTDNDVCVHGVCVPPIPDGDSCSVSDVPGCMALTTCVTNGKGQGTCTTLDPACASH